MLQVLPEVCTRAVRLCWITNGGVYDHPSGWASIFLVFSKIGRTAQTLLDLVRPCGKQRGRPCARSCACDVRVRQASSAGPAARDECLDLALLIDAEDEGSVRRGR